MTHELRSPVSVIRSLLRTIVVGYVGDVNEQQKDILERASRRSDYLQKLIDDLLELAAGKVEVKSLEAVEPVSIDEVVLNVIKRFEVPANDKGLSLEWHNQAGDSHSQVMGSAEVLDRVFNNLVSNAVKYTPLGGIISVTLSHVGSEAWVAVEDSGIGIPDEALPHLFEEFYRAPNAKEVEREGTGLGLTIVKDAVTRFGGRLSVQSKLGEGTTFTVMLPLVVRMRPPGRAPEIRRRKAGRRIAYMIGSGAHNARREPAIRAGVPVVTPGATTEMSGARRAVSPA